MERVQLLSDLNKRIAQSAKPQAASAPFILTLIKKCNSYKIPYSLMERLNYTDLLYMVVDQDIDTIKDYLRQKEQDRLSKRGVEVQELNPEQAAAFFRGGK
jgi:hypothetical protein